MPGSSLWLLPPADHPLQPVFTSLIKKTAAHFSSPHLFIPHITLTTQIEPEAYGSSPQKWLDDLPFPSAKEVEVKFGRLDSEEVFVRKLYVRVKKEGVRRAGEVARRTVEGYADEKDAEKWAEEMYMPHLSLLYHDCPKVDESGIAQIEKLVEDAGVKLDGEGELGGWVGGRIVLVPTDRAIEEWVPIAERVL